MNTGKLVQTFWNNDIKKVMIRIITSIMFCAGIMWLTDYDNVLYQTLKDQALNKAMMAW